MYYSFSCFFIKMKLFVLFSFSLSHSLFSFSSFIHPSLHHASFFLSFFLYFCKMIHSWKKFLFMRMLCVVVSEFLSLESIFKKKKKKKEKEKEKEKRNLLHLLPSHTHSLAHPSIFCTLAWERSSIHQCAETCVYSFPFKVARHVKPDNEKQEDKAKNK